MSCFTALPVSTAKARRYAVFELNNVSLLGDKSKQEIANSGG